MVSQERADIGTKHRRGVRGPCKINIIMIIILLSRLYALNKYYTISVNSVVINFTVDCVSEASNDVSRL